jgi:hypothetical protein
MEDDVENMTIKGSYVTWPTMIPPMKDTCNRWELLFSQSLEALRKDVCAFGILKGCWRILKTGIQVHNTEVSNNIWMRCYCTALHNLLLDIDGLSHKWEEGVPSSYETDAGQFLDEDIPVAIRRLIDPTGIESHRMHSLDSSRFGFRNCNNDDDDKIHNGNPNDTNHLRQLHLRLVRSGTRVKAIKFRQFRAMLIDNFNIAFHENKLKWPERFAKMTRPVPIIAGKK